MIQSNSHEEQYGIWMTTEVYNELLEKSTQRPSRITWPECVFYIFVMFFICVALGIIFR